MAPAMAGVALYKTPAAMAAQTESVSGLVCPMEIIILYLKLMYRRINVFAYSKYYIFCLDFVNDLALFNYIMD